MTDSRMPPALRARLVADYTPVRPLPAPFARVLWLTPAAALLLAAAPLVFELRVDAPRLGWTGTWGVSSLQAVAGLVLVGAALREAVPGRGWGRGAVAAWLALPAAIVVAVTLASWGMSPMALRARWLAISGMCFTWSLASALPVVAMAAVLAARAYPTRPALSGALLGSGAGLMADGGWRLFCHYSEPAHVLSAHLAAVIASAVAGALLAPHLLPRHRP